MESSISKDHKTFKLSTTSQEDIYDIINQKAKEFLESVHPEGVSNRFYFKKEDFSKIHSEVKSEDGKFNKIFFYPNYSNVR
jgi:uracil DNA glycosylase